MSYYLCECDEDRCQLEASLEDETVDAGREEGLWMKHVDCVQKCGQDEPLVRTVGQFEFRKDRFTEKNVADMKAKATADK